MIWGVSSSAPQSESAASEDGKGLSIWDEFIKGKKGVLRSRSVVRDPHRFSDSADFYYRYEEDIALLAKIGFRHFRFSISWPRVMPDGVLVNPAGLDFYKRVVDTCLDYGITPWVTLYHWDLPAALQKKGGWTSREIMQHFERYALTCVKALPEVKNWIVLNEPSVFLGAGYLFGIHAPGKRSFSAFTAAAHHAMLTIGHAARVIKDVNPDLQVGSTFSFTHIDPYDESEQEQKVAELADTLINKLFFEPVIGLGYPEKMPARLRKINNNMRKGDEQLLHAPLDFIGIQTYTREVFRRDRMNLLLGIRRVLPYERSIDLTAMNWEIYPECLYHTIMKVHRYGTGIPLYVTENGVALDEKPVFGRIHDSGRIRYYQTHINEALRAKAEGAQLEGYFAWSLTDNFEWAEGCKPRFGLIYVDYDTKERILKDSAHWFKGFLEG